MNSMAEKILSYVLGGVAGLTIGFIYASFQGALDPQNMSSSILGFWMLPENKAYFRSLLGLSSVLGLLSTFALRTHQRVSVLRAEAQSYNEAVTILSHQLRTTLTVANWGIEITLKNYDAHLTPSDRDMLKSVSSEIQAIVMQSVNLLDIATVESGKMTLSLETVYLRDLAALARETVAKFQNAAIKKNVILRDMIHLDPDIKIQADPLRLRFILENITENALNYTPEGKSIELVVTNDTQNVQIVIKDQGIGIPLTERSKIFNRFYRASNARNVVATGTGIGLYLTKEYVGLHHGTIRFETQENVGTTFFIDIPIKDTAHPEEFFSKI